MELLFSRGKQADSGWFDGDGDGDGGHSQNLGQGDSYPVPHTRLNQQRHAG